MQWETFQRVVGKASNVWQLAPPGVKLGLQLGGVGIAVSRIYKEYNPTAYMAFYLRHVSAGKFVEPTVEEKKPWVPRSSLQQRVEEYFAANRGGGGCHEGMLLVSGLSKSGKTSGIEHVCAHQGRRGFFIDLGKYDRENSSKLDISNYVIEQTLENTKVQRQILASILWHFLPLPTVGDASKDCHRFQAAIEMAFKSGGLTLIIDEAQVIANNDIQHGGLWNTFCKCSGYGPVILASSEYHIPTQLRKMSHVYTRTDVFYSPTASPEEMWDHVVKRFGKQYAEDIIANFDGSFRLLKHLDGKKLPEGIDEVRKMERNAIKDLLGLTITGMNEESRAKRTGYAMLAAAWLAFGPEPEALDPAMLELAAVHGAKVEQKGDLPMASFATPATGEVLKELVCDTSIHEILKKRLHDTETLADFQAAIAGKCPNAPTRRGWLFSA